MEFAKHVEKKVINIFILKKMYAKKCAVRE